jgi:hypothetical protein
MAHKTADEYLIYAFSNYKANLFGVNKWRFVAKDTNAENTIKQARQLYQSKKYERVEVKKKSFDSRKKQYRLSTYEILGKNRKISVYKILATALLIFALCGQLIISNIITF